MRNPFSSRIRLSDDFFVAIILAVIAVGVFWPWLFEGRAFYWGDIGLYFAPHLEFLKRNLCHGTIPLWNPEILCGTPFVGNPQMWTFSPAIALLPGLETHRYIMVSCVVNIYLGGLFFYYFLTRSKLRLRWVGAMFGGIVYMLGGFLVSKAQFPNMLAALAWVPLCMLFTERLVRGPSAKNACWLGFAFGLQLLAAHAQISLMTLYLCAGIAFTAGKWWRAGIQPLAQRIGWLVASGLIGAALDAVQFLPVMDLWQSAKRQNLSLRDANRFYLTVQQLTNFFWPDRYGHPIDHNFVPGLHYHNYWETACYIGIVPTVLVLATALVIRGKRSRVNAGWWVFGLVVCVWLSLGHHGRLYIAAYKYLPGVKDFHDPARFLMGAAIGAAVLAAMTLDRLLFHPSKRWQGAVHLFALAAIIFTVYDLGHFDRRLYPLKPISEINSAMSHSKLAQSLVQDPILKSRMGRVMMLDSERVWTDYTSYADYRQSERGYLTKWYDTSVPNLLMGSGLLDAYAYEPFAEDAALSRVIDIKGAAPFHADLAGRMSVEQIVGYRPKPIENTGWMDRDKTFPTGDPLGNNIFYYTNKAFVPRVRFVEASSGGVADPKKSGTPSILVDSPNHMVILVPPSAFARTLVVSDSFNPGWSANLAGARLPIWQTADGFRKLRIPQTTKPEKLVFTYQPMAFRFGLFVTLITLGLLASRVGISLMRRFSPTAPMPPAPLGLDKLPIPGEVEEERVPELVTASVAYEPVAVVLAANPVVRYVEAVPLDDQMVDAVEEAERPMELIVTHHATGRTKAIAPAHQSFEKLQTRLKFKPLKSHAA